MEGVSKKIGIDKLDLVRILEFLPYPFLVSETRDGIQHNIFANSRFLEEIGYSCDDLPTIQDWFIAAYPDPSYREKIVAKWSELALKAKQEREDSFLMPAIIHTRHHGDIWYEVKASVHGPVHFVAFVNIDSKIKREEELFKLNHNKDQTLSILGHDLRSPLTSLLAVLQMITTGKVSEADKENLLLKLTRQVFQMTEFLETTLNWTRTNFSISSIQNERLDLTAILNTIVDLYELSLTTKQIRLNVELDSKAHQSGDPQITAVILRNIVSNAVKYTPSGGEINISDAMDDDEYVVIVHNTGPPIAQKTIHNILERNVSSQVGTEGEKGLGLGLKLSQQLLEKIGGRMQISRDEKGTAFKVILRR
jgi:signal transduction histidine kinase